MRGVYPRKSGPEANNWKNARKTCHCGKLLSYRANNCHKHKVRGKVGGWKLSPEVVEKFRNKKVSKETKQKIRQTLLKRVADGLHNNYLQDRSKLKRYNDDARDRRCPAYRDWRRQVWSRDSYTCRINNKDCCGRIEAHHILGWSEYPELRYQIKNGITLCHAHHPRKRAEEKRLSPYFMELVSVSEE